MKTLIIIKNVFVIVCIISFALKCGADSAAREPFWKEIREYQPTIKPEMIISIKPDDYEGKPIVDWKLDELALAMASASKMIPNHPETFGVLTVEIDTTGTEIEPDVDLCFGYESGDINYFFVYFDLVVMQDGEQFALHFFGGYELNEWAKSIGIAGRQDWRPL